MYLIQQPPVPYTGNEPAGEPWLGLPPTTNPGATTTSSTGSWLDKILGTFDKVVTSVGTVTGAVTGAVTQIGTTTQNTATGIKNTFGDTASDVGSDSITKSLKENLPYIIIGLAAFTLIIVLAIYASKRK